jgi:Fibronectin type III domain
MRRMRRFLLAGLLLLAALPLSAQFADDAPFPLTNTRYGPSGTPGRPVIASNGKDYLLVWWTPASIRVTKTVAGVERPRVGRPILPAEAAQFDEPSVVWTGSRFLVASNYNNSIVGRLLFANGEPASDQFTILSNAYGPQLATNGARVLMLYRTREFGGDVRAVMLNTMGIVEGNDQLLALGDAAQAHRWYAAAGNASGFASIIGGASAVEVHTYRADGTVATTVDLMGAVPFGTRVVRHVAIAASPSRYLVAWSEPGLPLRGAIVDAQGTVTPTTPIESTTKTTDLFEAPAVVWNGTRFDVAWIYGGAINTAHVEPNGAVTKGIGTPARGFAWPSLASAEGRTMLAFSERKAIFPPVATNPEGVNPNPFGGIVYVRELGHTRFLTEGYVAGYAAAEQIMLAATSGADSSLVLWVERTAGGESTWYGVRGRDGSWIEQNIAPEARNAFVASDGRNFMLITNTATGALGTHISSTGTTLEPLSLTGMVPTGVASNGTSYAAVGYDSGGNTIASLFTPTSVTVRNLLIRAVDPGRVGDPVIASDGREFVIAWLTRGGCQAPCPVNLQVLRLDSALARIDQNALSFPVEVATDLDAAWNGSNYGISVINNGQIRLYRIPPRGEALPMVVVYEALGSVERDVSIERHGSQFAIAWREPATETNRGALVNNDGSIASRLTLDSGSSSSTGPILLTAPGGLLASVASVTADEDPHHGAERVKMRVDAPASVPGAPRLTANLVGESIRFEWTLPTGSVAGYRVEYKVGDGSWNELEGWLAATERAGSLTGLPRNTSYLFRVRAWGDAGTGPYSNEALVVLGGKLRAVR